MAKKIPSKKPTKELPAPPSTEDANIARIVAMFPTRIGFIRKIHHLWSNHYRVNYHEPETYFVEESHFITVDATSTRAIEPDSKLDIPDYFPSDL